MDCKFCKELNEEKQNIRVDEIYINCAGHYNYSIPIICCPVCGTMLDKYKKMNKSELEHVINY